MSEKQKHLEFIQAVVNRLSHNSFLLKGWSVVLVSALLALSVNDAAGGFVIVAYLPALIFWGLDGYFLREEKKFRKLYDRIRTLEGQTSDFSMDTRPVKDEVSSWIKITFSITLRAFHGGLVAVIFIVMMLSIFV